MDIGMIITGFITAGIGIAGSVALTRTATKTKKDAKDDLTKIREELDKIARTDDAAKEALNLSYSKNISTNSQIENEVQRLKNVIRNLNEDKKITAFTNLTKSRERLHLLSIRSDRATKELKISYAKKLQNEKEIVNEDERLKTIITEISAFKRKDLMDRLSDVRNKLYDLAETNQQAKEEYKNSYGSEDLENLSDDKLEKEIQRLEIIADEIKDFNREKLLEQLKETRKLLCELAVYNSLAKQELNESYNKKITTCKAISVEIERLSDVILEVKEYERTLSINRLTELRENIYSASTADISVKQSLHQSYNKEIIDDKILAKEIQRLEEVKENINRNSKLGIFT